MPELAIHKLCTGCTACASVCPMQCIKMVTNEEGFSYPQIVQPERCVIVINVRMSVQ